MLTPTTLTSFTIKRLQEQEGSAWTRNDFSRVPITTCPESLASGNVIAMAASDTHGAAVGLCLVALASNSEAEVLSIFVDPPWRGHGVATRLLEQAQSAAQSSYPDCSRLTLTFNASSASAAALQRVLEKRGWSAPRASMLLVQLGREIMQAPWFDRKLPPSMEIFPWLSLSLSEREELEALQSQTLLVPQELWPFSYTENLEPSTSLGLRSNGKVVGWVVTQRVEPKLVRYASLYVRPDAGASRLTFVLLAEAIRRQHAVIGADSIGTFGVLMGNEPMVRVVRRKFARYARRMTETYVSEKLLAVET
jgi:GNAT superfamily N-acetyltransferase